MKSARDIVNGYKGGSLYLRGCDLSGVTLPQSIGGWINLSGCENIPAILPACVEVIR